MSRLRLRYNSTPARLSDIDDLNEFGRHGEIRLTLNYEGNDCEFTIGYTKPFLNKEAEVYANTINLNQNRLTSQEQKKEFRDWQDLITHNGTVEIEITNFRYRIIS